MRSLLSAFVQVILALIPIAAAVCVLHLRDHDESRLRRRLRKKT
jgi:hypothetical protein